GNRITGAASGGNYYGIVHIPSNSAANPTYNKIINNTIQNFYTAGIYNAYSNGTIIMGNAISNPIRTSTTTLYGIYCLNGSRSDTIMNNIVESPFGGNITLTSTFYG